MFADPTTVTFPVLGAKALVCTGRGLTSSTYRLTSGTTVYDLLISHNYAKRNRTTIRVTYSTLSTSALLPSTNVPASLSVYLVLDYPVTGVVGTDVQDIANGLVALLTSANLLKLINGET